MARLDTHRADGVDSEPGPPYPRSGYNSVAAQCHRATTDANAASPPHFSYSQIPILSGMSVDRFCVCKSEPEG